VKVAANEPPVDSQTDRQIRFDINCKINEGDLADVEMTLYPDAFEPVRLEYYVSKMFSGQDIKGQDTIGTWDLGLGTWALGELLLIKVEVRRQLRAFWSKSSP